MKVFVLLLVCIGVVFGGQLSSQNGRFVYGQISEVRADQFLLDTQTGQMWQMVKTKDGSTMLEPVLIESNLFIDGKMTPIKDFIPYQPYSVKK